ncbi:hypothetical protein BOX15_Mlig027112g1 [Macrostomum lignano]|uniref:Uncharacterized protein n=1 Tax=Macrostomum lignano TaxID=282301 RepID=A0A267FEW1_9PLAT|nr:hypothetical protein BOX15_Mlig027112g1 [Macrostomum lignano]
MAAESTKNGQSQKRVRHGSLRAGTTQRSSSDMRSGDNVACLTVLRRDSDINSHYCATAALQKHSKAPTVEIKSNPLMCRLCSTRLITLDSSRPAKRPAIKFKRLVLHENRQDKTVLPSAENDVVAAATR